MKNEQGPRQNPSRTESTKSTGTRLLPPSAVIEFLHERLPRRGQARPGTPSVIVSLWNVQDRSTADLMVKFYQQLGHAQDKTAALQQAKLKLIQQSQYAHPYHWAPFILIGEPK